MVMTIISRHKACHALTAEVVGLVIKDGDKTTSHRTGKLIGITIDITADYQILKTVVVPRNELSLTIPRRYRVIFITANK